MKYKVADAKNDFPIFKNKSSDFIYFDSAATAHKPQCVIDSIVNFYSKEYSTIYRSVYSDSANITDRYLNVREIVKNFINADSLDEIVFTKNTTESINIIASCYGKHAVKEGDEILITEMEHHSNIVPWQILAKENKARLVIAPIDDNGDIILDEFKKLLNERTAIVAVCHASNVLGTINPIKIIGKMAHSVGAKLVVDGAQSVAKIKVDVKDINADFYVFSGHKMFAPTGVGVMYVKRDIIEKMSQYHTGGGVVQEVTATDFKLKPYPDKFEAGTPMISGVIGLGEAIEYVNRFDMFDIYEYEKSLLDEITKLLSEISGVTIYGLSKNKVPIVSFSVKDIHPLDLGSYFALKNISIRVGNMCAQPLFCRYKKDSLCRVSLSIYNTKEEIYNFITILKKAIYTIY